MADQVALIGNVVWVQLIPLDDMAAILFDVTPAIAQKTEPIQATEDQVILAGNVPVVQVTPFVEVALIEPPDPPPEIAQKMVPLLVILVQFPTGKYCCVQVTPSGEVAAREVP